MPIGVLFSSYLSLRQKERVIKPAFSVLVVLRKVTLMSSYEILEEKSSQPSRHIYYIISGGIKVAYLLRNHPNASPMFPTR